jgi:hypothetical protein
MTNKKKQTEITSGEKKSIGFDYQYYFFLWKVLSMKTGESVGLEVKDDVHTELNNSKQIFYQIKHTILKKSDGSASNLTSLDESLWKTLSNWAKVITDKNDGRKDKNKQLEFLKKTNFVLASNKSSTANNKVLSSITNLQNNKKSISDIFVDFQKLLGESKDKNIRDYIKDVLLLDKDVLNLFLYNTFFELDEDEIIKKCKDEIKADKIPEDKINDVFKSLDSSIREDNFLKIKSGKKIEITFKHFYNKYRRHYDVARNGSLQIKEFTGSLPIKLEEQTFIKQILEIGDILLSDIELIAEYTRFKLKLENNLEEWLQKGELTKEEIDNLKNDAINNWKNKFRSAYRGHIDNSKFNAIGLDILDSMREKRLQIAGQQLETDMCNGTFYELSNVPYIGWRYDWEKYKK